MYFISRNNSGSLQDWLNQLKEFQLDSMFDSAVLARSYLYTDSVSQIESDDNSVTFEVGIYATYTTKLIDKEGEIYGSCTCPFDGKCKHLAASILLLVQT